jgi:glycosyltransferase involved in cell wall biosynthesis
VFASGPAGGGGIGQFVRDLLDANAAAPLIHIVAKVDPRGPDHWISTLWRLPGALFHLTWLRLRGRPVLHVHLAGRLSTLRKVMVIFWARALGFPCVAHVHEYGFAAYVAALSAIERRIVAAALRRCERTIVLGEGEARRLPALLAIAPERFQVIPNGAPAALTKTERSPSNSIDIVFVGALSKRKGVDDLLEACARLPRGPSWRLVLCGGGDLEAKRAIAERLGIGDRCLLLGQTRNADVRARLLSSRIFCLPSHAEGFSIALLEAMAAGCAVVATAVGEQGQALRDGENASVIEPGDIDAIAGALSRLIEEAEVADRLGARARETIAERFSIEGSLQAVAGVLRDAESASRR